MTMKGINWTYVLDDEALLENHMMPSYPMGMNILLARVAGSVYAVSGKCLHMACPLFTGKLEGYIITCPCHDWRFDIRTGQFLDCLLYTSDAADEEDSVDLGGRRII